MRGPAKESNLDVPHEFERFTRTFWQGSHEEATDESEWIGNALRLSTSSQRAVIKRFLEDLLSSDADGETLQRVWRSGSPSYGFKDDVQLRSFLTLVRDLIETKE